MGNSADIGGGIDNVGGTVTITRSTIRNNLASSVSGPGAGGGIANVDGAVTIRHSTIVGNDATAVGAGFDNTRGMVTVIHSTIAGNEAAGPEGGGGAGAFSNSEGTVIITDSTINGNRSNSFTGTDITNSGFLTILNSTIARNSGGAMAGILNGGQLFVVNSTIADNFGPDLRRGNRSGIVTEGTSSTVLLNTILARNLSGDCEGPTTSLGTNLIGDPTGCTLTLQPTDLTGDPGLDTFTDDGTPGQGHFPLLPTSQAIDAGNTAVCPSTDQLGQRRIGRCDIGAIRLLDGIDLVQADNPTTAAQASQ